jgi:hypothetical protein
MYETIQVINDYFDIALLLIILYSSIMWFWFVDDEPQLNNASFRFFLNLEAAFSIIILILSIISITYNFSSLTKEWVQFKSILTILSTIAIVLNRLKTKKYLETNLDKNARKKINFLRVVIIGLIMTNYTLTQVSHARENPEIQKEIKEKFKNEI